MNLQYHRFETSSCYGQVLILDHSDSGRDKNWIVRFQVISGFGSSYIRVGSSFKLSYLVLLRVTGQFESGRVNFHIIQLYFIRFRIISSQVGSYSN
jgi:hypothetical protein